MKFKTLATVGILSLVTQVAIAQDAPPFNRDEVPPLRTPPSFRPQADTNTAPAPVLGARNANRGEDVGRFTPAPCKKLTGKFPFNLDKIKVTDLVEQISRATCKNFILTADVVGSKQISVISRSSIDVDQAWQVFLTALEANDLAIVQSGAYSKISTKLNALKQNLPVYENGEFVPSNDGLVTMLYDVQGMQSAAVVTLVNSLMKANSGAVALADSSVVMFSESATNVKRILKILEKVDIAGSGTSVHIYELEHAKAADIKTNLLDILGGDSGSQDRNRMMGNPYRANVPYGQERAETGQQKIISDDRTNKLIIIASDKTYERIKEMIKLLDVEASNASSQGQMFFYKLKNADSDKIATTLSTLVQGTNSSVTGPRQPSFMPVQTGTLFEGEVKITSDKGTNSLLVLASPRDYATIRKVIVKLDEERTQVYVEAVIMDIGITDTTDLGLGIYGGASLSLPGLPAGALGIFGNPSGLGIAKKVIDDTIKAAGTVYETAAAVPNFLGTFGLMGLGKIALPGGSTFTIPSVGALLEAVKKSSNVDVLATPSIMTLDNEKATISVGEKIPTIKFTSNVASGLQGGGISVPSVEYIDVKLTFEITPHVNDINNVRLDIDQDVNERGDKVALGVNNDQFTIRTKKATTKVMAKDQQTVMIGGLINEYTSVTEHKIPLLGDIPVLGHLFKRTSNEKKKSNLVLVLTPYIIRNDSDLKKIHDRKIKEREDFASLYFGDKITRYDSKIDYSKKVGPLAQMLREVETEMLRVENGGPGLPGEIIIGNDRREKLVDKDQKIELSVPLTSSPNPANQIFLPQQPVMPIPQVEPDFVPQPPPQEIFTTPVPQESTNIPADSGVPAPSSGNITPSPVQPPPQTSN